MTTNNNQASFQSRVDNALKEIAKCAGTGVQIHDAVTDATGDTTVADNASRQVENVCVGEALTPIIGKPAQNGQGGGRGAP